MPRLQLPHPLVLLVGCVFVAAVLTHVVPAGEYSRREDPATKRKVVIAGSYHAIAAEPVGFFDSLVALPRGMGEAASVIFGVFLIGGAFSVVDRTGAFSAGVHALTRRLARRENLVVPLLCLLFGTMGAVEGFWEEEVALVPVLLLLARRTGHDAITVISATLGAAGVGSAFSPMNPFNVGIAQKIAELPLLSGWPFRLAVLIVGLAIWTLGTMRHAARHRVPPEADPEPVGSGLPLRHALSLAAVAGCFGFYVYGTLRLSWGFEEMSALFFLMGVAVGLLGGLGIGKTAEAYVEGFRSMALAAILIGVARAIFVVLDQGRIVDTMIHAMVSPLEQLGAGMFSVGMSVVQTIVMVPVPSSSGRAVLTLPILVPLSDLLGVSRQVTVLAYQFGPSIIGQIVPTDGALMAVLALAGIRFEQWLRFAAPICLVLYALALGAIWLAVAIGLR